MISVNQGGSVRQLTFGKDHWLHCRDSVLRIKAEIMSADNRQFCNSRRDLGLILLSSMVLRVGTERINIMERQFKGRINRTWLLAPKLLFPHFSQCLSLSLLSFSRTLFYKVFAMLFILLNEFMYSTFVSCRSMFYCQFLRE